MATVEYMLPHGLQEITHYFVDFAPVIPEGLTLQGVSGTHVPPWGASDPLTVSIVTGSLVDVVFGPVTLPSQLHLLSILGILSDNTKPQMLLLVPSLDT